MSAPAPPPPPPCIWRRYQAPGRGLRPEHGYALIQQARAMSLQRSGTVTGDGPSSEHSIRGGERTVMTKTKPDRSCHRGRLQPPAPTYTQGYVGSRCAETTRWWMSLKAIQCSRRRLFRGSISSQDRSVRRGYLILYGVRDFQVLVTSARRRCQRGGGVWEACCSVTLRRKVGFAFKLLDPRSLI